MDGSAGVPDTPWVSGGQGHRGFGRKRPGGS